MFQDGTTQKQLLLVAMVTWFLLEKDRTSLLERKPCSSDLAKAYVCYRVPRLQLLQMTFSFSVKHSPFSSPFSSVPLKMYVSYKVASGVITQRFFQYFLFYFATQNLDSLNKQILFLYTVCYCRIFYLHNKKFNSRYRDVRSFSQFSFLETRRFQAIFISIIIGYKTTVNFFTALLLVLNFCQPIRI